MRLNKYLAASTTLSRRGADTAIADSRVTVNGRIATLGTDVETHDVVLLDGVIAQLAQVQTLLFHKPVGYVVSRNGQGSQTIYDILPHEYHALNPIGRLDKDSSGLLLLTNDGTLAQELTHPSHQKQKVYEVRLDRSLTPLHHQMISDHGLQLDDGVSRLLLERHTEGNSTDWIVTMHEGRNRQIRRTFATLGYGVTRLHRVSFGDYTLGTLKPGSTKNVTDAAKQT